MRRMPPGHSKEGSSFKQRLWGGRKASVFMWLKRQPLSATQLRGSPQILELAHVHRASNGGRAVTLADRRPHSAWPPSGLHQSVLLFNSRPDTCCTQDFMENATWFKHLYAISIAWLKLIQHFLPLNSGKPESNSFIHIEQVPHIVHKSESWLHLSVIQNHIVVFFKRKEIRSKRTHLNLTWSSRL